MCGGVEVFLRTRWKFLVSFTSVPFHPSGKGDPIGSVLEVEQATELRTELSLSSSKPVSIPAELILPNKRYC
jgi:hypothetical protein